MDYKVNIQKIRNKLIFVQIILKYYRKRHSKVQKNPIGGKFIIQDGRQNTFAIICWLITFEPIVTKRRFWYPNIYVFIFKEPNALSKINI